MSRKGFRIRVNANKARKSFASHGKFRINKNNESAGREFLNLHQNAERLKSMGNLYFKSGDFATAASKYSEALVQLLVLKM